MIMGTCPFRILSRKISNVKKIIYFIIILSIFSTALSACSAASVSKSTIEQTNQITATVTPTGAPTAVPTPEPTATPEPSYLSTIENMSNEELIMELFNVSHDLHLNQIIMREFVEGSITEEKLYDTMDYPELIRERKKEIELFFKYLAQAKCVGEIGIDGSENNKNYIEEQKAIFMEIIQRCDSYKNKVISIHSRKAEAHVLDILESKITESSSNTYIMHWYTGDLRNLSRAVDLGCYFSINKKMADSKNGSVIIRKIPFTRLLLESDSPLISNISRVGELESDLLQCIKLIAKIKNLSQSEIVGRIEENQEYALKSLLQVLP